MARGFGKLSGIQRMAGRNIVRGIARGGGSAMPRATKSRSVAPLDTVEQQAAFDKYCSEHEPLQYFMMMGRRKRHEDKMAGRSSDSSHWVVSIVILIIIGIIMLAILD